MKPKQIEELLTEIRQRQPLVHNITNYVAMDITANVLLAAGASPAMVHAETEVEAFAGIANSLVINIGTLSPAWLSSMKLAATAAHQRPIPWVLDPVAAGATPYRTESAHALLKLRPSVLRGNASEVMALAGVHGAAPKGVDSSEEATSAMDAARSLARSHGIVVAVTGATDYVTDGENVNAIDSGHPLMSKITGTGCSASALVGAFLAITDSPFTAATAALAVFGAAGRMASRRTQGPGSFRVALIDALALLDRVSLSQNCEVRALQSD